MDARHQHQRPRSKSGFSFKSEKSDKSHDSEPGKRPKIKDLRETPAEKHKRHLSGNTKANPNAAMEEAQPADPDLSNPTRSRWERPLDTIRKFEQQIDGEYKHSGPEFSGYTSRRSSYHGGGYDPHRHNNGSRAGFYGSAPAARNNDPWSPAPIQGPSRNRYGQRMVAPQPQLYPGHAYQHSRDTVNTGLSNSSGEHWPTDPSSENSSIERPMPPMKDLGQEYGFNGFGGAPAMDEYDYGNQAGYAPPVGGNGVYYPPNYPMRMGDGPPEPIAVNTGPPAHVNTNGPVTRRPVEPEKRKSWFKRRFSKD